MNDQAANGLDWPSGGGVMGERIRVKDWSASPLGQPETWSQNVKAAVGICLQSSLPIVLWLGPDLRLVYNDAYIPFLGEAKHPFALGEPGPEVWKEIWPSIARMHEEVAAGRSISVEDFQMFFARRLAREEVYVTLSYSPIFASDRPTIDGVFCACIETTEKVVTTRRLATLRDLANLSAEPRTAEEACLDAAEVLRANPLDIPFSAIYLLGKERTAASRAAWTGSIDCLPALPKSHPALVDATGTAPWPLALVARTGQTQQVLELPSAVGVFPALPWPEAVETAFALPLLAPIQKQPAGFLIVGVSPRRILDFDYRRFLELVAGHLAAGADGYVAKPFVGRDLIARVDASLVLGRLRAAELADRSRLHELSTRLTATSDLPSLLREVLDATIELQGADFGYVQLYDDQKGTSEIVVQRGFTQEFIDHFRRVEDFSDSPSSRTLRQRHHVVVEDIEADPLCAPLRTMAASAGFRAIQSTPLSAHDGKKLVGVLSVHFRRVHRPSARELRLLDLYARQAADMIAFRLAEQKLRESEELARDDLVALTTLHQVSTRSLQSPELQPVLEMTLDAAISLAHGQRGNIQLLNDENGVLEIVAHRGFKEPFLEFFRKVQAEPGSSCGASMERGEVVVVDDVNASDIFKGAPSLAVLREAGVRAVVSVPLVARTGRFVGMTSVHYARPYRPDASVIQRLEVLGRQAADFIERTRLLHRLRESEARLQTAVHLAKLGCFTWNLQTSEMQWDDPLREMWGVPSGSPVTYEVWRDGIHPDDLARVEQAVRQSVDPKGDGICQIEYRVIGPTDGIERWIATRGRATFENGRPISFCGVAQDVTDHKRTETELESRVEERTRELLELNRQLRSQIQQREKAEALIGQLQRLDAIGQITSGVAHDFNNLLSVVLTNARLLSRNLTEPDDLEGVDLIQAAAERGTKLTAQLLAFAREQRLKPRIIDLNQKVANMRDLLAATLGDTVQLKLILHPQLWPALVDPTQLEMIILNMAINSRDAIPSNGSVTIETFNTTISDQPVRPEDSQPGEYVGLAIWDTGTGIPEHVLARAFEPFFTTKPRGKGSGLGLSQVYGFAKQSGGGVRIETRVGEGTCVKVFLPRTHVDQSFRTDWRASDQQRSTSGK